MNADGSIRAALLTAPAPGAIAVIRIVGVNAWAAIKELSRKQIVEVGRPTLVTIVDGAETVDEALVVRRIAGDVDDIELSVHGGVGVTRRVFELLRKNGVAITQADELPLSGEIHPLEADVDRALMTCEARRLTEFLLAQRTLLPPFLERAQPLSDDQRLAYQIRTRVAMRLLAGLRVAIVGPPNAGKSTLANALMGRDRIIVADVPGTTRDWVCETVLIDGWPISLTDTAGIRETTDALEAEAIRRGKAQAAAADATIIVLDGMCDVEENLRILKMLTNQVDSSSPATVVFNKADAIEPGVLTRSLAVIRNANVISARTGDGLDRLRREILIMLGLDALNAQAPSGFLASHLLPQ